MATPVTNPPKLEWRTLSPSPWDLRYAQSAAMTSRTNLLEPTLPESLHGVLDAATLRAHGVHRTARTRLVDDGVLQRGPRGSYILTGAPQTYEQHCAVALLAGGPDAAVSRSAAARLHGLDGFAPRRAQPTAAGQLGALLHERKTIAGRVPSVNVPVSSGRRVGVHRIQTLEQVRTVAGLCVTGVAQTLIELGAGLLEVRSPGGHRLRAEDLVELALESALHQRLTTLEHISDLLNSVGPSHSGAAVLRRVLALRPPGIAPTESWLETRSVQVLRAAGIDDFDRQVEIWTAAGERIGRVDLRRWFVIIECDGREWHPDFEADRQRWVKLQSAGYLVLPATFRLVEFETPRFVASVRELIAQASPGHLAGRAGSSPSDVEEAAHGEGRADGAG